MIDGPFDSDNQFAISHELLQLFKWLFENEQEALKRLIERSLKKGLNEKISNNTHSSELETSEDVQYNVIDFFGLLEMFLCNAIHENEVQDIISRNLIPSINKVDSKEYDNNTLIQSLAKASAYYERNPNSNPKDALCQELLKCWRPSKKTTIN